ncbi:glycerol-3-phosphate responsive antiterminator [Jeotgalicoccus sp. FSL K6-3177]|uniref:glycerol-3-phosphate responsive antiterminator n=1 Tax=Jeotgalicoccus sp. FSL K6-3177 TaxID=2921494 RepID=UPI0030FD4A06
MPSINSLLKTNKVFAACKPENIATVYETEVSGAILMNGTLNYYLNNIQELKSCTKPLFIHTDLIKGLSNDKEAIHFIAKHLQPAGIVSTKSGMIRTAKSEGLLTIMRIFLIDTSSLKNSIKHIKDSKPDAIEIMPGIAPEIVKTLREHVEQPIILGGLIWNKEHIDDAFQAGADAVSLSKEQFWDLRY